MSAGCHSSVTSPSCTLTRHRTLTFSTTGQFRHTTVRLLQRGNRAARKQNVQIRAGLLSIFMPKQINKSADLAMVNELLETASRTDGGASTSQDQRKTIRDLVRLPPVDISSMTDGQATCLDRPLHECLRLSNFETLAVSKTPCIVTWLGENTRQVKHQLF